MASMASFDPIARRDRMNLPPKLPAPHGDLSKILLSTDDPTLIRREWGLRMMDVYKCQSSISHNVGIHPRTKSMILTDLVPHGSRAWRAFAKLMDGTSGEHLVNVGATAALMAPMNGGRVYARAELPSLFYRVFWQPFGIHSALTINAIEDGRFLGTFNVFRIKPAPPLSPLSARDQPWIQSTIEMLRITHAMFRQSQRVASTELVLFSSEGIPQTETRIHPSFLERISDLVREHTSSDELRSTHSLANTQILLTTLYNSHETRILAEVTPLLSSIVPQILTLSLTLRRVGTLAADGATTCEIADALSLSPETIRSHMKQIYRAVGVNSRAELVQLVGRCHVWHE